MDKPLDPKPWRVIRYDSTPGKRFASPKGLYSGAGEPMFYPRPQFEQDPSAYVIEGD